MALVCSTDGSIQRIFSSAQISFFTLTFMSSWEAVIG